MPVKVMGSDGSGRDFDIAEGIRWAADHGAQVINLSLGGPQAGTVLADAVSYAASKDCVLVATGGNENAPRVDYPTGYTNCIAVGATGFDGVRAPYSNRGRNLEVVAPGGNRSEDLNGDGEPDGIVAQTFDPQQGFDAFSYQFWEGTRVPEKPQVDPATGGLHEGDTRVGPLQCEAEDLAIELLGLREVPHLQDQF